LGGETPGIGGEKLRRLKEKWSVKTCLRGTIKRRGKLGWHAARLGAEGASGEPKPGALCLRICQVLIKAGVTERPLLKKRPWKMTRGKRHPSVNAPP